jgi:cullin 1
MGMGSLDIYTEDFEKQLLVSTQEFYARKSESWLQNDSTPTYL